MHFCRNIMSIKHLIPDNYTHAPVTIFLSKSNISDISYFFLPDLQEHTEQTDPVDLLPETIHQSTESPTLPPTLSMVELFNKRRQKLMQRKLRIAELSNSILENPQENVSKEAKC